MQDKPNIKEVIQTFMAGTVDNIVNQRPEMEEMLKPIKDFDLDDPSKLEESMIKKNPSQEAEIRAAFKNGGYRDVVQKINDIKNMF